jgi:hypothetical protein
MAPRTSRIEIVESGPVFVMSDISEKAGAPDRIGTCDLCLRRIDRYRFIHVI